MRWIFVPQSAESIEAWIVLVEGVATADYAIDI